MIMSNNYRLVKQGLSGYGELVETDEWDDNFTSDKDWYYTAYYLGDDAPDYHKKNNGKMKGYRNAKTDTIWFDFDGSENLDNALKDTKEVISRLKNAGLKENSIDVYFSGGRGFHVFAKTNKMLNRTQVEHLATQFGKDLSTFDNTMYDELQLIRVPNTKHPETGLYKVQLSIPQLNLTMDKIKEYAKQERTIRSKEPSSINESLLDVPKKANKNTQPVVASVKFDANKRPAHWRDYKWALLNAHMVKENERHEALMIIAATCKGLGYDQTLTTMMCLAFDEKFQKNTGKPPVSDLEDNIIPSVFDDAWSGGQYSYKNNKFLQEYCKRIGIDVHEEDEKVYTIYDVKDQYVDFVKNIDKNTVKTGIRVLDESVPITIGMNLGIVGAASSGKTALAVEILKNTSNAGVISVFASLDMHRNRLMEKLLYKVSGLSRQELYKRIQDGKADDLFEKLRQEFKNVYFYDRSCPTVKDIREYIKKIEQDTGQKVKLVMVDYFERVNADKSDETAASKEVAGGLQDIINDFDVAMITLVQPNKFSLSGGPDSPITNYTAIKGSSFLYQSFRSIISIWRPFFTPETKDQDVYLQMAILKNDLGELDLFNFKWDGKRGMITEFSSDEEQEQLDRWLKEKEQRKNKKSEDEW